MSGIIGELSGLLDLAEGLAWAVIVVFVRIGAVVALMPGLGDPVVPQRIKLALVVALTIVLAPLLSERLAVEGVVPSMSSLGSEAVCGLVLGVELAGRKR